MSQKLIETGQYWTAWQLIDGCTKVSPACQNCWSEAMAKRFFKKSKSGNFRRPNKYYTPVKSDWFNWQGKIILRHDNLDLPLRTKKNGKPLFPKPTTFAIWNDLFHESVPFEFIKQCLRIIQDCPQHQFYILTKRPKRIIEFVHQFGCMYAPNMWIGVTVENQEMSVRVSEMMALTPYAKWFVSFEPLLEKIRWEIGWGMLHWAVVGAETGPKARYCPIEWIEYVVEQGKAADVLVWVKAVHIGTEKKFKIVHKFNELPENIRVRDFPRKLAYNQKYGH